MSSRVLCNVFVLLQLLFVTVMAGSNSSYQSKGYVKNAESSGNFNSFGSEYHQQNSGKHSNGYFGENMRENGQEIDEFLSSLALYAFGNQIYIIQYILRRPACSQATKVVVGEIEEVKGLGRMYT